MGTHLKEEELLRQNNFKIEGMSIWTINPNDIIVVILILRKNKNVHTRL